MTFSPLPARGDPSPETAVSPGAVLVVDDNPVILHIVKSLLASERFTVFTAENGEEALAFLREARVDVVVCDVMMPRMDGHSLYSEVRATPALSGVPFVFLTALGGADDVLRAKESGCDDYVTKPFDPRHLVAVVRGKARRSREAAAAAADRHDAYRKRIVNTLSHEFRTPLVAISSGTELLLDQRGEMAEERTVYLLEAVRRGSERLERLVNDFMLLQQAEAGIAERAWAERACVVTLDELFGRLFETAAARAAAAGFEAARCPAISGPAISGTGIPDARVLVFEAQVAEIVERLTDNAIKFSGRARELTYSATAVGADVILSVGDRGIGFDTSKASDATAPFVQLDRERLEQQGTGLGLAVAARYAAINGGALRFTPRAGGGTTASLVLPAVHE